MRLIDADALRKKAQWMEMQDYQGINFDVRAVSVSSIDLAPAIDAVEVVRCKDCARDGLSDCPICYIEKQTLQFINHDPNFFCGYGERRAAIEKEA